MSKNEYGYFHNKSTSPVNKDSHANANLCDTPLNFLRLGNNHHILDVYCKIAREMKFVGEGVTNAALEKDAKVFLRELTRQGGIADQLKKYLGFDIGMFDAPIDRYLHEIAEILGYFYLLKHKYYPDELKKQHSITSISLPKTEVIELLAKPSMENIDNSGIAWKTSNGIANKMVKYELETILTPLAVKNIKGAMAEVVPKWDAFLDGCLKRMDYYCSLERKLDFDKTIHALKSVPISVRKEYKTYKILLSPAETLYLKILQLEYIGQIKDIQFINRIQSKSDYRVPVKFVGEMKKRHKNHVEVDDIAKFIDENAMDLAKYVYLRTETDKEDRRRIRDSSRKVLKILEFCVRARPLIDIKSVVTELWIISCLQAVLRDRQNEIFNYVFYDYERQSTKKPAVQGALKGDKHPYDALQVYWVRKVTDHWYANIGRYDSLCKLRELETACDKALLTILHCPNIEDMLQLHHMYFSNLCV